MAAEDEDDEQIAMLATLPEHEYRITIASRVIRLQRQLEGNTEICANIEEIINRDLKEVKDILTTIKGGLVFFKWIGIALKWVTIVVGAFTAVFGAIVAGDKALDVLKAVSKLKGGGD